MKLYFNEQDRVRHLIVTMAMTTMQDLLNANSIDGNEKKTLEKAISYIQKFNDSVFERLGDGYRKSMVNKIRDNKFILTSRYSSQKTNIENTIDNEILLGLIDSNYNIECKYCQKEDCKKCGTYIIKSYLSCPIVNKEKGCPFKSKEDEDWLGDYANE